MDTPPQRPAFAMAGFEVLSPIGRGAYGDVWLARTAVGGLYRAIKVVYRDRFPKGSRAFETEYKGLVRFLQRADGRSRQLAILHAVMQPAGDVFYYVMELADDAVRRDDLDPATYRPLTLQALRGQDAGDARKWLRLAVDLAEALEELHRVVQGPHRDIKPGNLIIVGGRLKIADIGLVTSAEEAASGLGTPDFVANPLFGNQTKADDIWCVGKVLYFMLFGTVKDWPSILRTPEHAHIVSDPLFREINHVINKACECDPAERYASAEGLVSDLKTIDAGGSVLQSQELRRRLAAMRRYASVAATAAVVLAAAFATWVVVDVLQERSAAVELEREARSLGYLQLAVDATSRGNVELARRAMSNAIAAFPEAANSFGYQAVSQGVQGIMAPATWTHVFANGQLPVGLAIGPDGMSLAVLAHPGGYNSPGKTGVVDVFRGPGWKAAGRLNNALRLGGFLQGTGSLVFQDGERNLVQVSPEGLSGRLPFGAGDVLHGAARDGRTLLQFQSPTNGRPGNLDIILRDAVTGRATRPWTAGVELEGWEAKVRCVSPSGNLVAVLFRDQRQEPYRYQVMVWGRGTEREKFRTAELKKVYALAFSPDDRLLAIGMQAQPVVVLDTVTWTSKAELDTRQAEVRCLSFSPDSRRIASGDALGRICLADVGPSSRPLGFIGHSGPVNALEWFPDGRRLASVGEDGTAKIWDVDAASSSVSKRLGEEPGTGILSSTTGSYVLVSMTNQSLARLELPSRRPSVVFTNLVDPISWGSAPGEFLAMDSSHGLFRVDVSTGSRSRIDVESGGSLFSRVASRGGEVLALFKERDAAVAGEGKEADAGFIRFLSVKARQAIADLDVASLRRTAVAFSPDAAFAIVAVPDLSGGVRVRLGRLDLATGQVASLPTPPIAGGAKSMEISPDGAWLAIGLDAGEVAVVDLRKPIEKPRILVGHEGRVFSLAFSPDGSLLASGDDDGFVVLWSVAGFNKPGRERRVRFAVPADAVTIRDPIRDPSIQSLVFSGDGSALVAMTADGHLRHWSTRMPGGR